ncbi:MAG: hypothetical protein NDI94_03410 [Candidatus Woesearchaeota archaeon]|nr:hypothetical protein [Candidatus Woesearchaeota archaeon]
MREIEIENRFKKYKEAKPRSRRSLYFIYAMLAVLLVFTVITKAKPLLFLLLAALCAVINYHTDMMTIRITTAPHLFASLFITRVMGLHYGIMLLVISTFMIHLYTARMDMDTVISLIANSLANVIMSVFGLASFVVIGLVLVSLKFLLCLGINLMIHTSPEEILFEHVSGFISNLFLFLVLGNAFIYLFS